MNEGKKILSELKLYNDYFKWNKDENRYETWNEAIDSIIQQHREKYDKFNIEEELSFVEKFLKQKKILASQRNLQFRKDQIFKHNARMFNCSSTYIDRVEVFNQIFYLLLCGCGVGFSVEKRYTEKLPTVKPRKQLVYDYIIADSIEGWADAIKVLMTSYFEGSEIPIFDYSLIRPKGSFISGGFIAPGPDGLKKSLEIIEHYLNQKTKTNEYQLKPIECYDIICHISNAVLSGGVRRSALICLFDIDDEEMINAKTGTWWADEFTSARARSNNSAKLIRGKFTREQYDFFSEKIQQFGEPGFVIVDDERFCTNPLNVAA